MLRTLPSPSPLRPHDHPPRPVPAPASRRRGGQPSNTNAFKHGLYSHHPGSFSRDFENLRRLRQLSSASSQIHIQLLEQQVRDTFELLIDHFLDTDSHLGPHTTVKLDRFFRTVSVSLRLKRRLKKLRDARDFLPNLAKNALPLAALEFTDPRISAFAIYGANRPSGRKCHEVVHARIGHPGAGSAGTDLSFISQHLHNNPLVEPQDIMPQERSEQGAALPIAAKRPRSEADRVNRQSPIVNSFVPPLLQKNHTISTPETLDSPPFFPENPLFPPSSTAPAPIVPQPLPGIIDPPPHSTTPSALPNTDYWLRNTDYFFPLTPSQQSLLTPVLASLRAQLESMAIRVRKQSCPDLFLLQIILLRLAFGLRWSDLPKELPLRACQLLYKHLCTSGRMQLIYRLLYEDLAANGRKNLLEMVQSGAFQCEKGRIYLSADNPVTWESFTGLLLLQRACLNQRRLKRAIAQEHHRRGRYEREPSLSRPPRASRPRPQPKPHIPFTTGLIPVSDCRKTNPILNEKLGRFPGEFPCSSP